MAKGAAMIAPNMATMLARAARPTPTSMPATLAEGAARGGGATSFNSLTVDGCTSTNDTVLVLASGRAGASPTRPRSPRR